MPIALSTSCFGSRFKTVHEQIETARSLGFERIEIGLNDLPPDWKGISASLEEFGMKAPSLCIGSRETASGNRRQGEGIASGTEEIRTQAIQSALGDIELAKRTQSSLLSIGGGYVELPGLSDRVRSIFALWRQGNANEANKITQEIQNAMKEKRAFHLDRLCRSLFELARREPNAVFAIETPLDPQHLPTPEELEKVFEDLPNLRLAYYHDAGRAALLEKILGIPHGLWLEKFVSRMAAVRLHDLSQVELLQAPGLGEVDWKLVSNYLPKTALRVLTIHPQQGLEAIPGAMRFLEKFDF